MKKLLVPMLALVLLFALASCNNMTEDDISKIEITLPNEDDQDGEMIGNINMPKELKITLSKDEEAVKLSDSVEITVEFIDISLLPITSEVLFEINCPGFSIQDEEGNVYEDGLKKELLFEAKTQEWVERVGYNRGDAFVEYTLKFTITPSTLNTTPKTGGKMSFTIKYEDYGWSGEWEELVEGYNVYYVTNGEDIGYSRRLRPLHLFGYEEVPVLSDIEYDGVELPDEILNG